LSGIHYLRLEAAARDRGVASSLRAADLAGERYRAGIVSYLDVVDANRVALESQRAKAIITGQRLTAAVRLVKALGGGWSEELLATSNRASRKNTTAP